MKTQINGTQINGTQLGGTFTFPGTDLTVNRMGYGAMQLAGPGIFGPPRDIDEAKAVLREVIETGINHIDTSDYYGPYVTNKLIAETLHPYPKDLVIVSKVGARRGDDASWLKALGKLEIKSAIEDNLRHLKIEAIDIVNLRLGEFMEPDQTSVAEPLSALIEMKEKGYVKHIGLSTVSEKQLEEALTMTDIVCIQNMYNIANRSDDTFIDKLAARGIAYVPYFPLGGFAPLQLEKLNLLAHNLGVTPMQLALAWLLHRAPNMLMIPGTSSRGHLKENIAAAALELSDETMTQLNSF